MLIENLLWEKWRPKSLEDIILLPRIRKHFESGLNNNYIFYGRYGTGKTSLARILIGKYTKDKPFLEINSSLYTSIDVLRNEIEDFCKFKSMMETDSPNKYVYLDEFDRVSPQFQDALKAFIEKYSKNGVRFILATNHINKVSDGIKSRIPTIDFDFKDKSEEKYLKIEIFKRIKNTILESENKEVPKDKIVEIINKKFPDIRSIIVEIQNYILTGNNNISSIKEENELKLKLYNIIYDKSADYNKIYNFLISDVGQDNISNLFKMLGKPFIDWSISKNMNVDKLFKCNYIVSDYEPRINEVTDPIILGMTVIGKIRDALL